ncbi:MAG: GAF domain-containing sensor histidine kinase [Leptolyngbyaceae cyanobacterium bins.302]|nr:GAF domain-containing sensor histidine kinase [Leptolyngbyaceae cyanobacterium bins.302]
MSQNQKSMEFRQRKSRPFVDRDNPQSGDLPNSWDLHSYSLPHAKGVASVRNTSALAMNSQTNFSGLLKQFIHIAATSNTTELFCTRSAEALGKAFDADGCTVITFKLPFNHPEMSCWLAGQDIVPIVVQPNGQSYLMQRSLHVQPSISNAASTAPNPTASVISLAESIWQYIQVPTALSNPVTDTVVEISIQVQGVPNGIISLVRSQSRPWTAPELDTLELISQQVAATFSHLRLQQFAEQQLQYQNVVNQLALAVRNTSDVTNIFQLATESTSQVLNGKRGLLLRVRYADPLFRNHAPTEIPKARITVVSEWIAPDSREGWNSVAANHLPSVLNQSFWLSECNLCQQVFNSFHSVAIDDTQQVPQGENSDPHKEIFQLEQLNSLIITPLENQGTILGFLIVQDSRTRGWQQADIELMDLVSAQVSNAIIQTETLRQVQSLVEKRTAELQQSLTVQAKLYERTRQQIEQLRHLNQLKDEFLDTVSHELRTPLTSMSLAIRMLRQVGTSSDRSDRYLDILEQQCAQETNLVNDLLALRELESKQVAIQLEEINLVELIAEVAQSFRQRWEPEGLSLELEFPSHPVKIQSDRDSLNRVLVELFTNAGKFSTPNSCVQLKLIYHREVPTNQVILSLTNIGSGISPEELPYIFDKFRRCQGATENAIQGTGLGLALVKSLVQHLNGTISASSAPLENSPRWETCFSVILPQTFDLSEAI